MQYVKLGTWVSEEQKKFLKEEAKRQTAKGKKVTEAVLVREAIYKVYKVK